MPTFEKCKRFVPPFLLLSLIALTRLSGLVRGVLLAGFWGVGEEAAAFELAHNSASFLFDLTLGALLSAMFVPAFTARLHGGREREAMRFTCSLLPTLAAVTLLLYLPLLLFPKAILTLAAGELTPGILSSAADALRLLSVGKLFLGAGSLFVSVQQADGRPLFPAALYALSSSLSLAAVALFGSRLDARSLSLVLLLLDLLVLAGLFWRVAKGHGLFPAHPYFPAHPLSFLKKAAAVMLFSAFLPFATYFASLFASRIGGGEALAANGYAAKPVLLTAALLSSVQHALLYPRLSSPEGRTGKTVYPAAAVLLLFSLFPALFFFFFAKPFLSLLYLRGSFDAASLALTASFLKVYALALPPLTLAGLFNDLAYIRGKASALAATGIAAAGIDLLLFFLLRSRLGLLSVPLSFLAGILFYALTGAFLAFGRKRRENKIRVALVLSDANIGGAGRQLLNYLENCDRESFAVTVILPQNAALTERVTSLGYPVLFCGEEASFSLRATLSYYRLFRKNRFDILHANASLSARMAAFFARVPVRLYTRHCVYPLPPLFRHTLPRFAFGRLSELLSPCAIAVAEGAAENLYGMGISKKRVAVIPNGVRPVRSDKAAGEAMRAAHGFSDALVAVICGRLEPDKGIATLIRAAALLRDAGQNIRFLVVGTGSEEESLLALTETLALSDYVHFCGFVSDVAPYLNAADVYLNCSVGTEATSLAIAEAMSLSLPVIATDYGGNPEMVEDGVNGLLIPQSDPKALADALTALTDKELRHRLGQAAYEVYTARYGADIMARRNEALYKNLFAKKARKGFNAL